MYDNLKRVLIGKPLKNEESDGQRYGILWGLPILASDAISSVAYAGQEMLLVMLPVAGALAYDQLSLVSGAIIVLLLILTLSYRQTIEHYPNGGGAYIVAKDNLGTKAGVTAGAALCIDYILTVAVSISSGVEQITSAFTVLKPYTVIICIAMVLFLMIGNLRGIREASKLFGLPAYAFMIALLLLLIFGFAKIKGGYVAPEPTIKSLGEPITLILLLRAFSSGCTALTGVEAVSNAVPNFKSPSVKYAKTVLLLLSIIILVLFGGTSVLANMYHVVPGERAMLVLIAEQVFGHGFMYYYVTITTFIILIMAANTAYSGFPLLLAVMAKEGFVPRQLSMKGDRLSYSNGILFLSAVASGLIILFKANVTSLIGLYAIGVFISFTLSQAGMLRRWLKTRGKNWVPKAIVNGLGALATTLAVIIIAFTKFHQGAWVVIVLIPILIVLMFRVKRHYENIRKQLKVSQKTLDRADINNKVYTNRVIVPLSSVNKSSIRALKYGKTISPNVTAFCVATDEESAAKVQEKYNELGTPIPLIIKYNPYRKVVEPLLEFIESAEYEYKKGDIITVILPQFVVKRWWQRLLHNQTGRYVERKLLKHKHIVVAVMPLQLND
ncbi:amino acid/polyamine/organocation transporter, APC superfamily (TC 2.A.3) [Anaerocolumna jejuensis DSM 15929]|uniref:Amino acid/polyamine/organocation transporter, APC superfamily (TC 2.A.3) n=1 Tax=Anaerocolumna jejuensis DSM 15929 TaxID=1121322 RepID=A0A1M6TV07_9FIRM|nr:amino acid permease [Anaerocolumna jejuensis]SHK60759.1 amino acid/polyamine/organocation transporter, APC superfamily (TC 2.A.3) [Anaerocolumna jejuensis DSM 15929]